MKKITVSISCDEEKLSALKMYLAQKEMQVETELEKAFDTLYSKTVPAGVREFIDMKSGTAQRTVEKPRKAKPSFPATVGAENHQEVKTSG